MNRFATMTEGQALFEVSPKRKPQIARLASVLTLDQRQRRCQRVLAEGLGQTCAKNGLEAAILL